MKRLIRHIPVRGVYKAVTGLRIGAGGGGLEIGGLDNPIIRHPVTKEPYVPGSSLKGKMRSLLEVNGFTVGGRPKPNPETNPKLPACGCGTCAVCWLFGCGDAPNAQEPTRFLFRDSYILGEDMERLKELLEDGIFYSEVKAEVVMSRRTGRVGRGGPRPVDRIAAGTRLHFEMSVRVFEGDNEEDMKQALVNAVRLLEQEGLGGSVSRGYGKVQFLELKWGDADLTGSLGSRETVGPALSLGG
jgi:CRISPR-associated protein Csm3